MNTAAQVGYIGSVQLQPQNGTSIVVRVTSADIRTSQEITYPDLVDSRVDNTTYQMGPKITGGNIAFPLVHEGSALGLGATCTQSNTSTLAQTLWAFAAQRGGVGRLENKLDAHVRYADNTAFTYPGCYVNSMTFNIVQSESVNVTAELFGGTRDNRVQYAGMANPDFLSPARIVTWNDAVITVYEGGQNQVTLTGTAVREFSCTINNGLERIYTMNGRLAVQDIVPKKRELSGVLKLLGRDPNLGRIAFNNDQQFTSNNAIAFGYKLGNQSDAYWATAFYGVIFQLEEMAVTTGVFETTHNWRALGDCNKGYLATMLGANNVPFDGSGALPAPTTFAAGGSNNYGNNSACGTVNDPGCFPQLTNTNSGPFD